MTDKEWAYLPPKGTLEGRRRDDRLAGGPEWATTGSRASAVLGCGNSDNCRTARGDWIVQDWICEDMFKAETVSIIAGPPGTYKTHFALDLALAVAYGGKWLGKYECLQGPVYYLAGELLYREIDAMKFGLLLGQGKTVRDWVNGPSKWFTAVAHREPSNLPRAPLSSTEFWARVYDMLEATPNMAARPKLWIFDPVAYLMTSATKDEDIKPVIDNLFRLAKLSHAAIITVLHHRKAKPGELSMGLDEVRGPLWTMYADNVLQLAVDPDDRELVRVVQSKNRGTVGEFLCRWRHTPVVEPEWGAVVREAVGTLERVPYAVPGGISRIDRWWIGPNEAAPSKGANEPQTTVTIPTEQAEEGEEGWHPIDAKEWDVRMQAVFATLQAIREPVSESSLYRLVRERYNAPFSKRVLHAILAHLEQESRVAVSSGPYRARCYIAK